MFLRNKLSKDDNAQHQCGALLEVILINSHQCQLLSAVVLKQPFFFIWFLSFLAESMSITQLSASLFVKHLSLLPAFIDLSRAELISSGRIFIKP